MMGISLLLVFCSASNCYLPLLSSLLTLPVYLSKVSCSFYWSWRRDCRHVRRWVWGRGDRRALTSTLSLKPLQIVPPPAYFPSFCPHSHTCVHWCDEYSLRWTSPDSGHQSLFELAQFLLILGASRCLAVTSSPCPQVCDASLTLDLWYRLPEVSGQPFCTRLLDSRLAKPFLTTPPTPPHPQTQNKGLVIDCYVVRKKMYTENHVTVRNRAEDLIESQHTAESF